MLTKYIDFLRSKTSGKTAGLFFIVYLIFPLLIFPLSEKFQHQYSGRSVRPLDLEFGFTSQTAFSRVEKFGNMGRKLYALSAMTVDIAYPVVYSTFFTLLILYLLKRIHIEKKYILFAASLPFAAAFFDLLENLGITTLLLGYPSKWKAVAIFTSVANMVKWSFVTVTLFTVAVLFFIRMLKSIRKTYN
jgi:hypothetical protein